MWRLAALYVLLNIVLGDDKITKVVELDYGIVSGEKYWDGDFYTFYGIPYASIPTGRDRFKVQYNLIYYFFTIKFIISKKI